MIKTKIKTKGMHCKSCEILVKDELEETEGVKKASVSHKTGIVEVEFDDSKIDLEKIRKVIENEGYKTE